MATDDDLIRTIRRGQLGTSMPAFEKLTDTDIALLVEVVQYFRQQGLREEYFRVLAWAPDSGLSDAPQAVDAWIRARTATSDPLAIPEIDSSQDNAARGKKLFEQVGCGHCHAVRGHTPKSLPRLFDSLGRPLSPVDLARDGFHGGSLPEDVYKRLVLGIPGTPHPAVTSLSEIDLQSLVAYVLSIRVANASATTNFERSLRANSGARMVGRAF